MSLPGVVGGESVSLSAYADDVTVFVRGEGDVEEVSRALVLFEVNWEKSEGMIMGRCFNFLVC